MPSNLFYLTQFTNPCQIYITIYKHNKPHHSKKKFLYISKNISKSRRRKLNSDRRVVASDGFGEHKRAVLGLLKITSIIVAVVAGVKVDAGASFK